MVIRYEAVDDFRGWDKAPAFLKTLLAEHGCRSVLEVGSGANPTLQPEFVRESGLRYITSDLEESELVKADPIFERLVIDFSEEIDPALADNFDCVFSRMVNEHIRDGGKYHKNIFRVLRPGGLSVHCYSSLWTLPFAVNALLPEFVNDRLLQHFAPRDSHQHGKFKAYYSWSRGPSPSMIRKFQSIGFEIIEYIGCFGHGYYSQKMPWLHRLERFKTGYLLKHPIPQLCSYGTVILRKPK